MGGGTLNVSRQRSNEDKRKQPADRAIVGGVDNVGYQRTPEDALQRSADSGNAIAADQISPAPWRPLFPGGAGPPLPLAEAAMAVTDLEEQQQLVYGEWDEEEEAWK